MAEGSVFERLSGDGVPFPGNLQILLASFELESFDS